MNWRKKAYLKAQAANELDELTKTLTPDGFPTSASLALMKATENPAISQKALQELQDAIAATADPGNLMAAFDDLEYAQQCEVAVHCMRAVGIYLTDLSHSVDTADMDAFGGGYHQKVVVGHHYGFQGSLLSKKGQDVKVLANVLADAVQKGIF